MDEDWSFVYKKEAHCDPEEPADLHCGDDWDHTAVDPESRLLLSLVPGKRTAENCQKLVDEVQRRTGGRTNLIGECPTRLEAPVRQIKEQITQTPVAQFEESGSRVEK
ncbi:MAG: hypothetical protein NTZ17_01590, partial [Phycisphaerae bacterium]|nr:hypothetical protein [Phycisphaerae bacterium]